MRREAPEETGFLRRKTGVAPDTPVRPVKIERNEVKGHLPLNPS